MPRFAILTHDHPELHWDFLLEEGEHLLAWRLLEEPLTTPTICARVLPPHRKLYLDYEGPVSNNRGTVTRWDTGTFEWCERSAESYRLMMHGQRLRGKVELLHPDSDNGCWAFQPDA